MVQKGKKGTNNIKKSVKMEKMDKEGVNFILWAPEASQVNIAGDFNNWDIHRLPMKRNKENQWEVKIKLPPGRYEYKYFVDGAWFDNVPGVEKVWNSYGTQNCVIYVN